MAIRKEDWVSIDKAIEEAITNLKAELKPQGARRIALWLREWGLVATAVTVPLTLLGLLITAGIYASTGMTKEAEFRAHTEDKLKDIDSDIKQIKETLGGLRLSSVSSNPTNSSSAQEVKKVLASARAAGTKFDQSVIKDAGHKFIDAAKDTPDAWNAALALLDYRSLLNSDLGPQLIDPRPANAICYVTTKTHILTFEPVDEDVLSKSQRFSVVGGGLSDDSAAHMEEIGKSEKRCGAQFLIFEMPNTKNELLLDGLSLKNVVVRDTRVAYHGGPIQMENVYFINCTFDFPSAPASRGLATAILETPAITFNKPA